MDLAVRWIGAPLDESARAIMQDILEGRESELKLSERRALRDPSYYKMLMILCNMFSQQNDYKRANLAAKAILQIVPSRMDVAIEQAKWLELMGQIEESADVKTQITCHAYPVRDCVWYRIGTG